MGGLIAGALAGVFSTLFGLVANILGTITGAFLGVAVSIFNWVCSENFISLSYTRLDNPFIELGWTLTRDLTNIFFVLALVVIGLGTALRIKDYQAKKALPILIIIALLINFTPVILGLIVDASNIVMNFFISGGFSGGNSFANFAISQWSNVGSLVGGLKFWDPTASNEAIAAAVGSLVLVFFNLIAALIYLFFAFLFVIRYIAIWILVILSPFAFACYIFPATRSIFSQWWKQFIQWSIIGVIATFFLYLGDHFIRTATRGDFITASMSEISGAPGLAPIINSILPYFIAIAVLFIGLFASLSFAPKGADAILKGGQKGVNKAAQIAGKKYWAGTKTAWKAPGQIADRYRTARVGTTKMPGVSRGKALGSALSPKRFWKRWKPPLPEEARKTYKQARALGVPKMQSLRVAATRWKEWKAGPKTKAAGRGFGRATKDVWGAAIGKKAKLRRCPQCGSEVPQGQTKCSVCGYDYAARRGRRTP